jgi:hypothetical protein
MDSLEVAYPDDTKRGTRYAHFAASANDREGLTLGGGIRNPQRGEPTLLGPPSPRASQSFSTKAKLALLKVGVVGCGVTGVALALRSAFCPIF